MKKTILVFFLIISFKNIHLAQTCPTLSEPLPPDITASNSIICRGETVNLSISGTYSFLWNTGQTTSSINVNPSITTTYSVTLTHASGCSNVVNETINVRRLHVTTTADIGENTLRQAILCANYRPSFDTITFDIPTSDLGFRNPDGIASNGDEFWNIALAFSDLPVVTDTLVINGLTQSLTDCSQVGTQNGTQNSQQTSTFNNSKGFKPRGIKLIVNGGGIANQQIVLASSATLLLVKGFVFINWINESTNGAGTIKLEPRTTNSKITLECAFMSNKI